MMFRKLDNLLGKINLNAHWVSQTKIDSKCTKDFLERKKKIKPKTTRRINEKVFKSPGGSSTRLSVAVVNSMAKSYLGKRGFMWLTG